MAAAERTNDDLRMLRIDQVLELFPISRVSLYRLIREKKFPAPEKFGGISVWWHSDIKSWADERRKVKPARHPKRDDDDLI